MLQHELVDLDRDALWARMVQGGLGGYCFQHTCLLLEALRGLGFEADGLVARVYWRVPPGLQPGRGHGLVRVHLGGARYIVDTGFGRATPTAPLELVAGPQQQTPHGYYRLRQDGGAFMLECLEAGLWQPMYAFTEEVQHKVDYVYSNWFTSTHPRSGFRSQLMLARSLPGVRLSMANLDFVARHLDGSVHRAKATDADGLRRLLAQHFALPVDDAAARVMFDRITDHLGSGRPSLEA